MKYFIFTILLFILLINFVSAQVGIYTPTSELSITDVQTKSSVGGGADVTFVVKNVGDEDINFNAYSDCGNRNIGERGIRSGESVTATISVSSGECDEIKNCKLFVTDNVGREIERDFSFINKCSLCGTEFESCRAGAVFCSGNQIEQCDNDCRIANVIQTCSDGCYMKDGNASCEKPFDWAPIFFYGGIILFIILIVLFLVKRKNKD